MKIIRPIVVIDAAMRIAEAADFFGSGSATKKKNIDSIFFKELKPNIEQLFDRHFYTYKNDL